jgi:cyclic pyranopterin phosphate synthase
MIVDISKKPDVSRYARASASASVHICNTAAAVRAAVVASRYLPFLHPIPLTASAWCKDGKLYVEGSTEWQTGVEMDVLFGALVGLIGSGAVKIEKLVVEIKLKNLTQTLNNTALTETALVREGDLVASAYGVMKMKNYNVVKGPVEKGHPIYAAQTAAALNVKRLCELIGGPCPSIQYFKIDVDIRESVEVNVSVKARDLTPAPEALFAAGVALLTIWDMAKKYEKDESGQYPNTYIKLLRLD